jgi:ribosomal protein S18 acetylase RimI-like enzyme
MGTTRSRRVADGAANRGEGAPREPPRVPATPTFPAARHRVPPIAAGVRRGLVLATSTPDDERVAPAVSRRKPDGSDGDSLLARPPDGHEITPSALGEDHKPAVAGPGHAGALERDGSGQPIGLLSDLLTEAYAWKMTEQDKGLSRARPLDGSLRRAQRDDVDLVRVARLRALAEEHWRSAALEQELAISDDVSEERMARRAAGDSEVTFLIVDGSECIGLVDGFLMQDETVEVAGLWVDPNRRRSGIGRALMSAVAGWAAAKGAENITLWVVESSEPAFHFYRSLGFTETTERLPVSADPRLTQIKMVWHLDAGLGDARQERRRSDSS